MVWLVCCQLLGPILRASAVAKENEPRREGAAWTSQMGDIWDIAVPCCSPFKLHSTTSPWASGWACSVAPSGSCWCGQKTNAAGRPGVGAHKMAGPGVLSKTKGSKGNLSQWELIFGGSWWLGQEYWVSNWKGYGRHQDKLKHVETTRGLMFGMLQKVGQLWPAVNFDRNQFSMREEAGANPASIRTCMNLQSCRNKQHIWHYSLLANAKKYSKHSEVEHSGSLRNNMENLWKVIEIADHLWGTSTTFSPSFKMYNSASLTSCTLEENSWRREGHFSRHGWRLGGACSRRKTTHSDEIWDTLWLFNIAMV